jgi:hypothetical protein
MVNMNEIHQSVQALARCTSVHTYIHTYIHTYTHTHTHHTPHTFHLLWEGGCIINELVMYTIMQALGSS